MWPEVKIAKEENRREIVLVGDSIDERIRENGLDDTLFTLVDLNYLCINKTSLISVPNTIENLLNLQRLSLHNNKISLLDPSIGKLTKLKTLDLSDNILTDIPDIFNTLDQIETINFSRNKLTKFPILKNNNKLVELNISQNKLEEFPDLFKADFPILRDLKLSQNQITSIPSEISVLSALRMLDVSSNKISTLPGDLMDCLKLKDLKVDENPFSDKKLSKVIGQGKVKQLFDYIKNNCPKNQTKVSTNSKKSNKNRGISESTEENSTDVEYKYKITVFHSKEEQHVTISKNVETVRKAIICCVVQGVTFNEGLFKKFIQIQNRLHENECSKRQLATIATHDFKKLHDGKLTYTTQKPEDLKLIPLNRTVEMTGKELFRRLQIEAENLRKEKKRNTYSGIHKYLKLIEGKPEFPCLLNSKGEVISFPPITNAEISKIELSTTDIFLEVTSSENLEVCKNVMTNLLKEMVLLFGTDLNVLQIRVNDEEGKLKNVFPSQVDLNFKDGKLIQVIRKMDSANNIIKNTVL